MRTTWLLRRLLSGADPTAVGALWPSGHHGPLLAAPEGTAVPQHSGHG
ncbi:hypothetical protein ACFYOV_16025 [Streptomyces sp. NPDC005931]